jgi:hypothetical protein
LSSAAIVELEDYSLTASTEQRIAKARELWTAQRSAG